MFRARALRNKERDCLLVKKEERYQALSWEEVHEKVLNLTGYFLKVGLQKGDRVALLSGNRPEWAITDLAILAIGCVTVPIYPTLAPKEVQKLLEDSGARCLVVSSHSLSQALSSWKSQTLTFEESAFSGILAEGETFRCENPSSFSSRLKETKTTDLASIIYTSGTTGEPKGVMLSHDNFLSNCRSCSQVIPISEKDLYLSFLPLSHVFERMAGFYFILFREGRIAYAENMETVFKNMQEVFPTVVSGVPRFFEKVHEAILTTVRQKSPLQQKLFFWALHVGKRSAKMKQSRSPIPRKQRWQHLLATFLVLRALRQKIGKNLRFFISGSAALSVELIEFFAAFGCTIIEGYGLTETSPVVSVNRLDRMKWGSVGLPIPGVEVKLTSDGEILVRGPNVMQGYFHREEATREVIQNGAFFTGDIGTLDAEGFLTLTDRKKDLIKTSGGKYVSPQKVEGLLKTDPLIAEAVVFGEGHKYIVALLVPNFKALEAVAAKLGISFQNRNALMSHPEVLSFFHDRVRNCLKELSSFEQVKRFALLEKELTQAEGELTPTLKVKRKLLYEKHRDLVESLFQDPA